jgi:hypothetical protein
MVTSAPQSKPAKPQVLDRVLAFLVLLPVWIALGRVFDHFNFLALHRPFRQELLIDAIGAAGMVIFCAGDLPSRDYVTPCILLLSGRQRMISPWKNIQLEKQQ